MKMYFKDKVLLSNKSKVGIYTEPQIQFTFDQSTNQASYYKSNAIRLIYTITAFYLSNLDTDAFNSIHSLLQILEIRRSSF